MGIFEIVFGLIFAAVGGGVFCIGFFKPEGTVVENAGIAMVVGGLFFLIGLYVVYTGIHNLVKAAQAKRNGKHYLAKIWAHENDYSFQVNHQPGVTLVLRFFDSQGRIRQELVKTGSVDRTKYDLGATIEISEYEGKFYLVGKRAEAIAVERQQELMDPAAVVISLTGAGGAGVTAAGTAYNGGMQPGSPAALTNTAGSMVVIACPGCSNSIGMKPGTQATCPFCSRIVTLTTEREIR